MAMVTARVVLKLWPPEEMGWVHRAQAPPERVWQPGRDFASLGMSSPPHQ